MKIKYFSIISIILIVCIFSSCNVAYQPVDTEYQEVEPELISDDEKTTELPSLNAESDNIKESETTLLPSFDSESEISQLSFHDYSEFKEFIDTTDKLPSDFVYPENISHLGAFEGIVFLTVSLCKNYEDYDWDYGNIMYSLRDSTDVGFAMYVRKNPPTDVTEVSSNKIDTVNPTDMHQISSNEHGFYVYEGIEYRYIYGKISSVRWISGGRTFIIACLRELGEYKDISKSNLAPLFNLETAIEFVSSIAPIDPIE